MKSKNPMITLMAELKAAKVCLKCGTPLQHYEMIEELSEAANDALDALSSAYQTKAQREIEKIVNPTLKNLESVVRHELYGIKKQGNGKAREAKV